MIVECAPLAGYTTAEFRAVLAECGARVLYTEMVSVAAIYHGSKKTLKLLERVGGKTPGADAPPPLRKGEGFEKNSEARVREVVQLFGHVPAQFEFAVRSGLLCGFDEININMGCPANKIVKNSEGVSLMREDENGDWPVAREIIEACVRVSDKPVSVKMRLGAKKPGAGERGRYVDFAKMCERAGASRLIVHGRYGSEGFGGVANWEAIGEIVRAVGIPVIANGDIRNIEDAKRCMEITGASGVMVGRMLLPLYKKYFGANLRILRGEKICVDGGFDTCMDNLRGFFEAAERA